MEKLRKDIVTGIVKQFAAYPWQDEEVNELVDPRLGIITGFQELLTKLEVIRNIDLGSQPPAQAVQKTEAE